MAGELHRLSTDELEWVKIGDTCDSQEGDGCEVILRVSLTKSIQII